MGYVPPLKEGITTNAIIGLFSIDSVTEVEWNEGAFDQLVLPHDYKTIVRAFVEAQMSSASGFDDIIRGKGELPCIERNLYVVSV